MGPVDRPSALDLAFLDLETPKAPLHVGWTLRFAGAPPSLAALRRHLEARLHAVPRFRRRLVWPALGLGGPQWADDPGFDVARHVYAVTVPPPGGPGALRDVAGPLLSRPLPLDRPLWRMYLVDGLHDGGFALVGQVHHALVDGVAAVEVALLLFGEAQQRDAARAEWTPSAPRSLAAAAGATLRARAGAAAGTARSLGGALGVGALREAARAVETLARPAPATALDRSATAERSVAYGQASLEGVREAGRRHGATINDMLLAASSLALRTTLRRRGERPSALRALVPVNVRGDEAGALGNRVAFLPVDLPLGEADPRRVLALVRERTTIAKGGGHARALEALAHAADALPGAARRLLTRSAVRAVGFNLVVSNVPGPPVELALLGRPLMAIHPMVPLLDGHALTICALSYAGRLNLGLAADAAVLPDVVDLARDLEAAFDALHLDGGGDEPLPGVPPWRTRARERRQRAASR
jgi:diacylglycerol O-acyltransferase / wax synthase